MDKKPMKSQKIYFIRHAESENNFIQRQDPENYKKNRQSNPGITHLGQLQVKSCSSYLKKRKIIPTQIICSCQKRALETAQILNEYFPKAQVNVKQDICEMGYCYLYDDNQQVVSFKGEGRSQLSKEFPKFNFDEDISEEGWNENVGGETEEDLIKRAQDFIAYLKNYVADILRDKNSNETIFIVTHGIFFDKILGEIIDRKQNSEFTFKKTQNTSITSVDIDQSGQILLNTYNDYVHLEDWCLEPQIKKEAQKYGGLNPEVNAKGML
ncbi:hypothetical protein PPERSA_09592 [Pseudocohnilembus persalinus]|uniref:Histidine phosphatase superfamily, clade-1 n=1 Tax=Pseudocohnilembus persalinus TaxID=266149 RepID=A0A0V0QFM2_PSEPJ|nr:hypothetical protein PPERSA_09592 [Pseudocohnilembus persalinus]|eukprot:KRX00986.1 hypothetical protein PPERSA_09592 [Pseudocohnilembus persalinus]